MAIIQGIITVRLGKESELNTSKLLSGEFGFTTDTKKLFIGTASGAKELAFRGDISGNITDEQIQEAVNKYLEENPIVSSNLYMRVDSGYIQFSQDNKNWQNVIALSDLKGEKGNDGVGISTVKQTTTSSSDGGTNVITVTKTDGSTSTFSVKNGSKGSTGAAGKDGSDASVTTANIKTALGYTPAKQIDVDNLLEQIGDLQTALIGVSELIGGEE